MKEWVNEKPLEYHCLGGTVFKSDRSDLRGGVDVKKPKHSSEASFGADCVEFGMWHSSCILPQLNGFPGWGGLRYKISD